MNEENSFTWLKGIDVSHHQEEVDWAKVKAGGFQFVFLKATEGGTYTDPVFASRREECRKNNLPAGAYHFFRPKGPVQYQITNFLNAVGRLLPGELPPVLDLEVPGEWKSNLELRSQWMEIKLEDRVKMVVQWCEAVEAALGVSPIIYMSSSFAAEVLGNAPVLSRWRLWVANYTTDPQPRLPAPWTSWTFWQYSESGRIDGIPANDVDLNWFNGSAADLAALQVPAFVQEDGDAGKAKSNAPDYLFVFAMLCLLGTSLLTFGSAASAASFGGAMLLAMIYSIIYPGQP